jgi:hypothetical protein
MHSLGEIVVGWHNRVAVFPDSSINQNGFPTINGKRKMRVDIAFNDVDCH